MVCNKAAVVKSDRATTCYARLEIVKTLTYCMKDFSDVVDVIGLIGNGGCMLHVFVQEFMVIIVEW